MAYKTLDAVDLRIQLSVYAGYKTATDVELVRIVVPLGACTTASLGRVDPTILVNLKDRRYDHSPVTLPSHEIGWGIVKRSLLEAKLRAGEHLETSDLVPSSLALLEVEMPVVPIELIFDRLSRTPAVIVHGGQQGPGSEYAGDVYGLLTASDLNHREVRRAGYELVVELESRLADLVRLDSPNPTDWIGSLGSEKERRRVIGAWQRLKRHHLESDPVALLYLTQLLEIAGGSPYIRDRLGVRSADDLRERSRGVAEFRNRIMHPVRPLVSSASEIGQYAELAKNMRLLVARLDGL